MSSSIISDDMSISPSSSSTSTVSLSNTITPPPSYITNTALPSLKPLDEDIELAARPSNIPGAQPVDQDIELAAPARPRYETSDERLSRYRIELDTAKENLVDCEWALRKHELEVEAQRRDVRRVEKLIAKEELRRGPPFRRFFNQLYLLMACVLPGIAVMAPLSGSLMYAMHIMNHYANHCHQTNPKLVQAHTNWWAQFAASGITLFLSVVVIVPLVHTRSGARQVFVGGFLLFMTGFCMLATMGFAMIPIDAWVGEKLPVKDLASGILCAAESSRPSS